MSVAMDVYIPTKWETSVPLVLTAAGFQVTTKDRKFAKGKQGRQYSCTRGSESITLTEVAITNDPSFSNVLALSPPKYSEALLSACDALFQHGAVDSETYIQRMHNA